MDFQLGRTTPMGAVATPTYPVVGNAWGNAGRQTSLAVPTVNPQVIAAQYRREQQTAKRTNEQRYNEILRLYKKLYGDSMGMLKNAGVQEKADILQRGANAQSAGLQDMVSRGLAGTSALQSVQEGAQIRTNADVARLNERLDQQRLATMTGLTQAQLGFMERRNDTYPDMNSMMELMRQFAV